MSTKNYFLPRQLVGRLYPFRVLRKGELLMNTYEEFQIILGVAMLIIAILNQKNK